MQAQNKNDKTSGAVWIQGDKVFWDYDDKNVLQFDINDIVVIGEYTTTDGPWLDDWFLIFITKKDQSLSIPFYANNIDELLQYLTKKFHDDFTKACLANSSEWNSIVLYPKHLKGKALFTLALSDTYKVPKTFLEKVTASVGFGNFNTTRNVTLTDEVRGELANVSQ